MKDKNFGILPCFRKLPGIVKESNMKNKLVLIASMALSLSAQAQEPLNPRTLWKLGRVSAEAISADKKDVFFGVSNYDFDNNSSERNLYRVNIGNASVKQVTFQQGGETIVDLAKDGTITYLYKGQLWKKKAEDQEGTQYSQYSGDLENVRLSPDGKYILFSKAVQVKDYKSTVKYPDLPKSNAYIYDQLDYRHWDTFNDGTFNHPFLASFQDGQIGEAIDLLQDEPYYSPQAPFGGVEDYIFSPDSKSVLYVCKKKFGTDYAQSTNTDIYRYDISSKQTSNITEGLAGYDTNPAYSNDAQQLAWLSMKTDGYEADKNDIILFDKKSSQRLNLTAHWDGTVNSFIWSTDSRRIYFTAAVKGTVQLFEIQVPKSLKQQAAVNITQISQGQHDITGIVGQVDNRLVVSLTKFTRATELYTFDLAKKSLAPLTKVNEEAYSHIIENKVESRMTKASDGADLFSWVIYPPNFDPAKKYPTILYCEGGPQSALTQFYSFRWNLQLIASQGYIVVAPNRRGMPGWGVAWNADISKDWGGQPIRDYLSAIDDISKESYVDTSRRAAIGASYGGYSVYMLAGVHENRFKTFIAHNGLFDMRSWYGTTEEVFFANHELGGPYWDPKNAETYTTFNPIMHVDKWKTPILVFQGGIDFRVPVGQGLGAFQAAQLKKIKSRLVYLPEENHWVLSGHNAQVWQREFFGWLQETL